MLTVNNWADGIFWCFALGGTLFMIIRIVLMLLGGDLSNNTDFHDFSGSSDTAFDVFTINTIISFIMMFGWIGLTCIKTFGLSKLFSFIIALIGGVICMLIIAFIFKMAKKLTSDGERFNIENTIGENGMVYQNIPGNGRGKIQITVPGDMTRELDAVSEKHINLESFINIKVVNIIDPTTVSVIQINSK